MPRPAQPSAGHRFGGDWTSLKLEILRKYLDAYVTALKHTRFQKFYIDAFAGTGYREPPQASDHDAEQPLLFPDLAAEEPQGLLDGSARIALQTAPPFDQYMFIERSRDRCNQLATLKTEFPALAGRIDIRPGEANQLIQALCLESWEARRAVLFLDPYGMQVEWPTVEAIAATRAIDLWLLFPLGIGVNRLLTRSGEIPLPWRLRLDLLLGTTDWYEELYRVQPAATLFDSASDRVVKASTEVIGRYFNRRLGSVFAGVAEHPAVLRNSTQNPLYLLCFAVGNARGRAPALRIANHILDGVR